MATKKTTSKKTQSKNVKGTTTKKAATTPVKKSVPKKAQKVSYRSATSKTANSLIAPSKWLILGLGIGWAFLSYGFASWAIDSGSLWHYLFTFISIYFFASYVQRFITIQFKK
jgi:hypothetical protein